MERRTVLAGMAAALATASGVRAQSLPSGMRPLLFHDDAQFWFETLRVMGATDYGGAQIGEAVMTASRIAAGDYNGWHAEWKATADAVARQARASLAAGRRISARDGLLRVSNYYRNSEFFLHADRRDPRLRQAYDESVRSFRDAAALFDHPVSVVEIPYEGTTLPGYLYRPDASARRRPLLIAHNGFDGSVEEMHFLGAQAALERGYAVLTFDGPGQFGPIHRQGLAFRSDWEKVVTPVVDFALTHAFVDPERIGLMGISMGGYLAPRAAVFERRLAACIANDGIYDCGEAALSFLPADARAEFRRGLLAPVNQEMDRALAEAMKASPVTRWVLTHGPYAFGVASPRQYMARLLDYSLVGLAEKIACPTLVCEAEEDVASTGQQAQKLYDHLTCPRTLVRFSSAEGAGAHCQVGALRLSFGRIFDWLDGVLRP